MQAVAKNSHLQQSHSLSQHVNEEHPALWMTIWMQASQRGNKGGDDQGLFKLVHVLSLPCALSIMRKVIL